jgi:hypothetical protein
VIDEINSLLAGSPRQQRIFLQMLRFLSNELGMALICAGTPEARQAMLTDPQLRSRFLDIELPLWRDDGDLRIFLARLVQSLPLRRPSPVDSPGLRRLIAMRSAGLTWTICKAFERAAVAAIASGEERLDRSGLGRSWDNRQARAGPRCCRSTGLTPHRDGHGRPAAGAPFIAGRTAGVLDWSAGLSLRRSARRAVVRAGGGVSRGIGSVWPSSARRQRAW